MAFAVQLNFGEKDLEQLLRCAAVIYGCACEIYSAKLRCQNGSANAEIGIRLSSGKTLSMSFGHEQVVDAIARAADSKGTGIDASTLTFTYHEGHGYGGSAHVTACAKSGKTELPLIAPTAGKLCPPFSVSLHLNEETLRQTLFGAARRAGLKPKNYLIMNYQGNCVPFAVIPLDAGAGSSEIELSGKDLNNAVREELNALGYDIEADGVVCQVNPGHGFGGPASISAVVQTKTVPLL